MSMALWKVYCARNVSARSRIGTSVTIALASTPRMSTNPRLSIVQRNCCPLDSDNLVFHLIIIHIHPGTNLADKLVAPVCVI